MRVFFLLFLGYYFSGISFCLAQNFFKVEWKKVPKIDFEFKIFSSKDTAIIFADSLHEVFAKQGFLLPTRIESFHSDTALIQIDPGNLHRWKEVKQGNIPDHRWKKLKPPGTQFLEPYEWMETLITHCQDTGYPFASVNLEIIKLDGSDIYGIFRFDEGPRIRWDSLEISGQTKSAARFLQLYSDLTIGKDFSQSQFEAAIRKMKSSPYFSLDSVPKVTFQIKSAKPHFILTDRKINVFDGIIGLAPNQNNSNSILLTGEFNLSLYHLGGKGRDISIHWQRPNFLSQNLEFMAKESYLFGSLLNFQLDFSLFKQDSSFVNRMFKLEFNYPLSESGNFRFFSKRQAGDLFGINDSSLHSLDLVDFRWNNYGIGYKWSKLDNPLFPRKGGVLEGEITIGNKRLIPNTSHSIDHYQEFEKSSTQLLGLMNLEKHVFINKFWGMWLRMKSGFLANDNLFLNEFFRLGGLKSIRGFNEMFFFADRFFFLNLEERFYLGKESYLLAFADLGWTHNPFFSPKIDYPRAFGLGINLDTEGGLFSFVIGLGKSSTQSISPTAARVHFGYSARF